MKFSFIVPIYNVAPYISRCIDSILNSDLDSNCYEIIVVDDGSSDNGPEIVKSLYIGSHSNIQIITQANLGLSEARNSGLKVAKGDYVWFVDGDDTLDDHLSKIDYYTSTYPGIDCIATRIRVIVNEGSTITWQKSIPQNILMTGHEAMLCGFMPSSVCVFIFRREFLLSNDLFFKPNITHEDVEFSYRMMPIIKSIIFTDYVSYNYIKRAGSLNQSVEYDNILKNISDNVDIIVSFMNLSNTYRDKDIELSKIYQQKAESSTFGLLIQLLRNKQNKKLKSINSIIIERLKSEKLYPMRNRANSILKRIVIHILNHEFIIK